MLLCDQVITDAETGKKTLVGVFDAIHPENVPFLYAGGFSVYARLSDAEGKYLFKVEVVYLDEDKALSSIETAVLQAPDRLAFVDLVLRIGGMGFEKFGKYEFQLFANNVYIGRSTITVTQRRK